MLETLETRPLGGAQGALAASDNYRRLRRAGITPRKTSGMLIGTYCLMHGLELLHSDRDFDSLEKVTRA